jgi:hypothetical protein
MKKQYRVRVTTYYPSFVIEAEGEIDALSKAYFADLPDDGCSDYDIEEVTDDEEDFDDSSRN